MVEDELSHRILRFRKELDLTQQALASFLGVRQRTVSRWERGVDHPSAEILTRLQALLTDKGDRQMPILYEAVLNAAVPLALVDDQGRVLVASSSYAESRPKMEVATMAGLPLVLVIEDDEAVLKATRAVLKRWQFLSTGVTAGEAALVMVTSGEVRPQGAIIDFLLPGAMDGVDTANALRQIIPGLPVLIVTGEATPERMRKIAASGLPVVTKPIDPQVMQTAMAAMTAIPG